MAGRSPAWVVNPFLDGRIARKARRVASLALSGRWRLRTAALAGLAAGLALLAFRVSNAPSYLSEAPETCTNCHVMNAWYAGWYHSSHRQTATCNDCHVPHDSAARKLAFKAWDGARHSYVFTLHLEPQVLVLNEAASPVVQGNCVRCHEHQIMLSSLAVPGSELRCWHCHRETPHGLAQSLSSTPHVMRPMLPSAGMPRPDTMPGSSPGGPGDHGSEDEP